MTATLPDGKNIPIIWIKNWDWDWQDEYLYTSPLEIPRGTQVHMRFRFDNSADNMKNPTKPPRRVRWGEQTSDEMAICFFQILVDRQVVEAFGGLAARAELAGTRRAAIRASQGRWLEAMKKQNAPATQPARSPDSPGKSNFAARSSSARLLREEYLPVIRRQRVIAQDRRKKDVLFHQLRRKILFVDHLHGEANRLKEADHVIAEDAKMIVLAESAKLFFWIGERRVGLGFFQVVFLRDGQDRGPAGASTRKISRIPCMWSGTCSSTSQQTSRSTELSAWAGMFVRSY